MSKREERRGIRNTEFELKDPFFNIGTGQLPLLQPPRKNTTESMNNSTQKIDWELDLCWIIHHRLTISENMIYVMGGRCRLNEEKEKLLLLDEDEWDKTFTNSHVRIFDFTRSRDISNSSDSPIRLIYMDEKVPRMLTGQMFAANNRVYVVGGEAGRSGILTPEGSVLDQPEISSKLSTHVWAFDLVKETWESPWENGLGKYTPRFADVAFDEKGKIGWMFGGLTIANEGWDATRDTAKLIRFDVSPRSGLFPVGKLVPFKKSTDLAKPGERIASGSMVYIPNLGGEGILVVVSGGGAGGDLSDHLSMEEVLVYDIKSNIWYLQQTTTTGPTFPPRRSLTCIVVASAQDGSSHNIYMYGGTRSGSKPTVLGDIWILSLPSFIWVQVSDNEPRLHRHVCANLQNHYMFIYQGIETQELDACIRNTYQGIKLFDLSRLEWTRLYQYDEGWKYLVPQMLIDVIGGNSNGAANMTVPLQGWSHSNLTTIFGTPTRVLPEDTGGIPTRVPPEHTGSPRKPIWVIVGSTLGGVVFLAAVVFIVIVCKRRRKRRQQDVGTSAMVNVQGSVQDNYIFPIPTDHDHGAWH